ncbi:MAG: YihY/virulence factor BrkB family protein [Thermodesulfobacteriota bacterium]
MKKTAPLLRAVQSSAHSREIFLQAGSLSFKLLQSLIPMLALIFAVGKGFGIQDTLEPIIMEHLMGKGIADDLIPKVLQYVDNTNVKALGVIGLIFILSTALSMISGVEDSFNRIWGVSNARPFFRRFTTYLTMLMISPLLLMITISLSAMLSSNTITQRLMEIGVMAGVMRFWVSSLPWLASIIILTLVYKIIPNTNVKIRPALIAGVIAGVCWQCNQFIFIKFQIGVARFNAIYGTFASVPIFMLWVFSSWLIVLYGARLGHCCQHKVGIFTDDSEAISFANQENILLLLLKRLCQEFDGGRRGAYATTLSDEFELPLPYITRGLNALIKMGYVTEVAGDEDPFFMPSKPSEAILLADFFIAHRQLGRDPDRLRQNAKINSLTSLQAERQGAVQNLFQDKTITSLYQKE